MHYTNEPTYVDIATGHTAIQVTSNEESLSFSMLTPFTTIRIDISHSRGHHESQTIREQKTLASPYQVK